MTSGLAVARLQGPGNLQPLRSITSRTFLKTALSSAAAQLLGGQVGAARCSCFVVSLRKLAVPCFFAPSYTDSPAPLAALLLHNVPALFSFQVPEGLPPVVTTTAEVLEGLVQYTEQYKTAALTAISYTLSQPRVSTSRLAVDGVLAGLSNPLEAVAALTAMSAVYREVAAMVTAIVVGQQPITALWQYAADSLDTRVLQVRTGQGAPYHSL